MSEVLKIVDRFDITGCGTIYIVDHGKDCKVRIGDSFFDLQGNEFIIKGIEMKRNSRWKSFHEMPWSLHFENSEGIEIEGSILLRDSN